MLATQTLEDRYYHLAQHYLGKLRTAEVAYCRGHENLTYGLALFDQEWLQIKHWWDWVVAHAYDNEEIAQLCQEFSLVGAEVLAVRLNLQERLEIFEVGLAVAQFLGDAKSEMIHHYLLARTKTPLGMRDIALDHARQALAIAQRLRNALYRGKISTVIGAILYHQDKYEQARGMYEQALAIGQALGEKIDMGLAVNGLAHIAHSQGDFERSRYYDEQYLVIAEAKGQPYDICMALRNLSVTALHMGDEQAAMDYAERCVALSEAIGYQSPLAGVLVILGDLVAAQGDLAQSRDYYQRSLVISREIHHVGNEALALSQLGRLSRQLGDLPASLDYLQATLDLAESVGDRWYSACALLEMAATFRAAQDLQQARTKLAQGLDLAYAIQSLIILALYLLEAAWLWYAQGQMEQAAGWIGFLQANFSLLVPQGHAEYHELYHKLAVELGQPSFNSALEQGRALDLESIVQALRGELRMGGASFMVTSGLVSLNE